MKTQTAFIVSNWLAHHLFSPPDTFLSLLLFCDSHSTEDYGLCSVLTILSSDYLSYFQIGLQEP